MAPSERDPCIRVVTLRTGRSTPLRAGLLFVIMLLGNLNDENRQSRCWGVHRNRILNSGLNCSDSVFCPFVHAHFACLL